MSTRKRHTKASNSTELQRIEQTEIVDDNLLPSAGEIERLSLLDPDILKWLKSRAEKEQEFRHQAFNDRVELTNNHHKRDHNTVRYGLSIYFILFASCLVFTYLLIEQGKNLEGTIFGGAAVILALAVLITKKPTQSIDSKGKN